MKCDKEAERAVMHHEGATLATYLGVPFVETSAKSGENVALAIAVMTDLVLEQIESGRDKPPKSAKAPAPGKCSVS